MKFLRSICGRIKLYLRPQIGDNEVIVAKRTVWRTDGAEFVNGQILLPRGDHTSSLNRKLHEAERLIRQAKSDGAEIRSNCVYVWENYHMAESNWKLEKDKHLYELEISETDILHRGSTIYVTNLKGVSDEKFKAELAKRYWTEIGDARFVELLVRRAVVVRKLKDKSETRPPRLKTEPKEDLDALLKDNRGNAWTKMATPIGSQNRLNRHG